MSYETALTQLGLDLDELSISLDRRLDMVVERLDKLAARVTELEQPSPVQPSPDPNLVLFADYMDDSVLDLARSSTKSYIREGSGGSIKTRAGRRHFELTAGDEAIRCELRPEGVNFNPYKAAHHWRAGFAIPSIGNHGGGYARTIIWQIHGGPNDGSPPLMSLEYFLHKMELRLYTSHAGKPYGSVARWPLVFDQLYQFEARCFFGEDGWHEFGLNGGQDYSFDGITDYIRQRGQKLPYAKYGLYVPSQPKLADQWSRAVEYSFIEALRWGSVF